jgi:hypothetical protein
MTDSELVSIRKHPLAPDTDERSVTTSAVLQQNDIATDLQNSVFRGHLGIVLQNDFGTGATDAIRALDERVFGAGRAIGTKNNQSAWGG